MSASQLRDKTCGLRFPAASASTGLGHVRELRCCSLLGVHRIAACGREKKTHAWRSGASCCHLGDKGGEGGSTQERNGRAVIRHEPAGLGFLLLYRVALWVILPRLAALE